MERLTRSRIVAAAAALSIALGGVGLAGCGNDGAEDEANEQIEQAQQQAEDLGEQAQKQVDRAQKQLDKAQEKIDKQLP